MDAKTQARFDARAKVLKALAHPTRLFIVDALSNKEHCVCELTAMIGADVSTVSKHLSVLKSADLVEDERKGNMVYYHLKMPCLLGFLSCVDSVLESAAQDRMNLVAGKSDTARPKKELTLIT